MNVSACVGVCYVCGVYLVCVFGIFVMAVVFMWCVGGERV